MPQIQLPGFENTSVGPVKIDPGRYQVNIVDVPKVQKDNKEDGTVKQYIEVEFVVRSGPKQHTTSEGEEPRDPTGMKITDRLYFDNDNAWFRIKQLMVSAGIIARDDTESPAARGSIDLDEWVGTTLTIDVVMNERNGKDYRNVNYVT